MLLVSLVAMQTNNSNNNNNNNNQNSTTQLPQPQNNSQSNSTTQPLQQPQFSNINFQQQASVANIPNPVTVFIKEYNDLVAQKEALYNEYLQIGTTEIRKKAIIEAIAHLKDQAILIQGKFKVHKKAMGYFRAGLTFQTLGIIGLFAYPFYWVYKEGDGLFTKEGSPLALEDQYAHMNLDNDPLKKMALTTIAMDAAGHHKAEFNPAVFAPPGGAASA